MKKNLLFPLSLVMLFATTMLSCVPDDDEAEPEEQVDMTISIGGVSTKMASFGFSLGQSNGKKSLGIPFLAGTLVKASSVDVSIPDFSETKSKYDAAKGEVKVTYEGEITVSGESGGEWVSEKGTVEITSFNGEVIEGKINATLGSAKNKTKVLELKDGNFKVKKF